MAKLQVKATQYYVLKNPKPNGTGEKHICYIDVESIEEEFLDWMFTNPRKQNMKSDVAKKISDSLQNNSRFHELNRGLVFSVAEAKYSEKEGVLTLTFEEKVIHGNIDGGHTLRTILDQKKRGALPDGQYVFAEIFPCTDPVQLAAARNTSVQLDTKSIAELEGHFDTLKEVVSHSPYGFADRVSYKMNQHLEDDFRSIDARELIAMLTMFDQTVFPTTLNKGASASQQTPIKCYTDKQWALDKYIERKKAGDDMLIRLAPIAHGVFKMWNEIEVAFPALYGKKYESIRGVKRTKGHFRSMFSQTELTYSVNQGFVYPALGAFANIVTVDDDTHLHKWVCEPDEMWKDCKERMVQVAVDSKATGTDFGKSKLNWQSESLIAQVYRLRLKL